MVFYAWIQLLWRPKQPYKTFMAADLANGILR